MTELISEKIFENTVAEAKRPAGQCAIRRELRIALKDLPIPEVLRNILGGERENDLAVMVNQFTITDNAIISMNEVGLSGSRVVNMNFYRQPEGFAFSGWEINCKTVNKKGLMATAKIDDQGIFAEASQIPVELLQKMATEMGKRENCLEGFLAATRLTEHQGKFGSQNKAEGRMEIKPDGDWVIVLRVLQQGAVTEADPYKDMFRLKKEKGKIVYQCLQLGENGGWKWK